MVVMVAQQLSGINAVIFFSTDIFSKANLSESESQYATLELFNQSSRPAATAVAVTVNWTANFIVSLSFLPLTLALGSYTFIIFAVLQLLFIIFIFFKVPETKNKTVEEITAMFRQQILKLSWKWV
ncbi:unnamed protein product [Diatraea saccharalis]|uniref:Uncharacterized protein n=1 Tax=Diatraea saccharalis TaxID=40085 RepID=A0A9N9R6C8_9NEOP|nr:unnamed protein product [Diatraea saccharalis]